MAGKRKQVETAEERDARNAERAASDAFLDALGIEALVDYGTVSVIRQALASKSEALREAAVMLRTSPEMFAFPSAKYEAEMARAAAALDALAEVLS